MPAINLLPAADILLDPILPILTELPLSDPASIDLPGPNLIPNDPINMFFPAGDMCDTNSFPSDSSSEEVIESFPNIGEKSAKAA
mmetsp:Transcript_765/g.1567  ORF Transcript_765/g.1567 Transcript_765/m.1567 type:complete len:85 (-) Transcript_765:806-1060(-)